jgi:phospholipase/carboxylesterase
MPAELLPAIEIETTANPDAAVIWMHGLGDDGRGWSDVVPALGLPGGLAVRFIFPHAPIMPVTINNGMRTLLAGFSQGGAIALYAGLRQAERLAGIVALSTYLIAPEHLDAQASAANRDVPIFMAHGTHDPVVAYAWAERSRDVLRALGYDVEWHAYAMEHAAVLDEIQAAGAFIARALTRAAD